LCSSISGGRQVGAAWIAAMVPAQSYHEMVADALLARPDLLAVAACRQSAAARADRRRASPKAKSRYWH
jgi:hypothetical protein